MTFVRSGQAISFLIVNSSDYIQSFQAKGLFYEEEDLLMIAPHFKRGGVFVDIGANTGQHSIYFTKLLGASKAILFEPVPLTCRILNENINLNGLTDICDLSHLGLGLSDLDSVVGFAVSYNNLGSTRLYETGFGNIRTTTGDLALSGQLVDFIKIDVEGFEIKVLPGLSNTIKANRPTIFVEIDDANLHEFQNFTKEIGYEVVLSQRRYDFCENFLIKPKKPFVETDGTVTSVCFKGGPLH